MTQEEKDLLLKDLCARLPYRVRIKTINNDYNYTTKTLLSLNPKKGFAKIGIEFDEIFDVVKIKVEEIKPYLFPLSSMTEEQYKEFIMISGWDVDIEDVRRGKFSCIGYIGFDYLYDAEDWFNKNHFDWRGLIPKNLAIDCTNLNIY